MFICVCGVGENPRGEFNRTESPREAKDFSRSGPSEPFQPPEWTRMLSPFSEAIISPEIHTGVKAVHDHEVSLRGRVVWEGVNNQAKMLDLDSVCQVVGSPPHRAFASEDL